jgi:hypothetical protein
LSEEAISRTLRTWAEYASIIGDKLFSLQNPYPRPKPQPREKEIPGATIELSRSIRALLTSILRGCRMNVMDGVRQLYAELLGREADASGLNYWSNVAKHSGSLGPVRDGMMASKEYCSRNCSPRQER